MSSATGRSFDDEVRDSIAIEAARILSKLDKMRTELRKIGEDLADLPLDVPVDGLLGSLGLLRGRVERIEGSLGNRILDAEEGL